MSSGGRVQRELARRVEERRKQDLVFAVAVVAATPGLIGLGVFVAGIFLGSAGDGSLGVDRLVSLALALLVGWNVWTVYRRVHRAAKTRALELALGALCGVALLAVALLAGTVGSWFSGNLALQIGVTMAALALLGRAYVPKERYELEADPFSLRDDFDGFHAQIGLAVAIPHFLLEAWGELFSGNLAARVPPGVVNRAAELLVRARGVSVPVERQDTLAVRLLVELKLASQLAGPRVELTGYGRDLLAVAESPTSAPA